MVLIGRDTHTRRFVRKEIERTIDMGKGLLGVYINRIPNQFSEQDPAGSSPFDNFQVRVDGRMQPLHDVVPTYLWDANDGYNNLGRWVDEAARSPPWLVEA